MDNEKQRHALITGATSGIGYELAKLFAGDGYSLVLVARSEENLAEVQREFEQMGNGIHVHTIAIDLFERGAAQKIFDETQSKGIRIEALVNNAGQGEYGEFTGTDLDREINIVQLNIIALISLTKLYLKDMVANNKGRILQLASSVSKAPSPNLSVYAATKAFVLSFTEAIAKELEETEVTITALQPGATDTDFFHKAKAEDTVTYKETQMYTPEEVAKAGYEGLMSGSLTVMPGAMNKFQGGLNNMIPDSAITSMMSGQMKKSVKKDGKSATEHAASARERRIINEKKGAIHGDL